MSSSRKVAKSAASPISVQCLRVRGRCWSNQPPALAMTSSTRASIRRNHFQAAPMYAAAPIYASPAKAGVQLRAGRDDVLRFITQLIDTGPRLSPGKRLCSGQRTHRSRIVNGALGTCALIEGEYIASTRLDGRL